MVSIAKVLSPGPVVCGSLTEWRWLLRAAWGTWLGSTRTLPVPLYAREGADLRNPSQVLLNLVGGLGAGQMPQPSSLGDLGICKESCLCPAP